jgi:glutathione S-transferase
MKLYYTSTSPYVRKVMVAAHETGLIDRIETIFLRPTPVKADPVLSKDNPLSKIPALLEEGKPALYDSPVICEYLDGLHGNTKLIPAAGPDRWRVLRTQALTDGILEAAILVFYEVTHRPAELHWSAWLDGQREKANQGLDALEHEVAHFGGDVDLAQICAGITIGWLEFRNVLGDIRPKRPKLFAWYDAFRKRPGMVATEPKA